MAFRRMAAALAAAVLCLAMNSPAAWSQPAASFPNRPVRLLIPFAPGGASDFIGRVVAAKFPEEFGQPARAAGNLALETAARSAPDGYTLFVGDVGTITVNPNLYPDLTVKPVRDFVAVARLASIPGIMVAHPSFPANSFRESLEVVRKAPGKFNYGSPGAGSSQRILMELLKKEAAIDLLEVPYKGGAGPAITGLIAGETHIAFATVASVHGFLKSGRVKPIATLTEQRLAAFPEVASMPESGFPRIVDSQWQGVFAPRGTAAEVVERLHAGLSRIMRAPETVRHLEASSAQPYLTPTPAEFSTFVERETSHWAAIIKEVGAKATN